MVTKKFKRKHYKYSGPKSNKFWRRINNIKDDKIRSKLYSLGCTLQNEEETFWREYLLLRKGIK